MKERLLDSIYLLYWVVVIGLVWIVLHRFPGQQTSWMVCGALFFSLMTVEENFYIRLGFISLLGLLTAFSCFIVGYLSGFNAFLYAFLFFTLFLNIYLGERYPTYYLLAIIINIFTLMASSQEVSLHENIQRSLLILAGCGIALLPQILFVPIFKRGPVLKNKVLALRYLTKLSNDIFGCFFEAQFQENMYLFEHRLHIQKENFLHCLIRLRAIHSNKHYPLIYALQCLFDNVLALSELRLNVHDHATFELCGNELLAVSQAIAVNFEDLASEGSLDESKKNITLLKIAIKHLEDNYQHILKISSEDPVVFLIFIDRLNALCEKIQDFNAHVSL